MFHKNKLDQKGNLEVYLDTIEQLISYLPDTSKSAIQYQIIIDNKHLSKIDALNDVKRIADRALEKRNSPTMRNKIFDKPYDELSTKIHSLIAGIDASQPVAQSDFLQGAKAVVNEVTQRYLRQQKT